MQQQTQFGSISREKRGCLGRGKREVAVIVLGWTGKGQEPQSR